MWITALYFPLLSVLSVCALPGTSSAGATIDIQKRQTRFGRGTWYNTGLGNCGITNSDDEPIVAISKALYDENGGSDCGKTIEITNTQTGQTATGIVEDSCPGCGEGDIDLSPSLFEQLAPLDQGVIQVTWSYGGSGGGEGSGSDEGDDDEGDGDDGGDNDEGDNDEGGNDEDNQDEGGEED
ncbi:hypothetical protein CVT26_011957 [Gymnopilus dilepis]|uniref:Uncharacterized protein n=1 Tax=Gymnopilus dilepis TaxID=231916 RepID=A0A409YHR5_9AGAR|nr:hypothetical protein CVT26_011957 [Gymnopilus dilepis]